ncbi:MAG: ABC transporter ATP-binding protein [Ruminococcaceae bacterium]|nr:ABC transporter ATP-binding protein [Oscillospiraceae bacterium]
MMGPPPGPPPGGNDKWKEPLPKNIREVPGYLKKVVGGTAHRMGYVFGIVWNTKKWILFVMMFMTLYDGVAPVVHSLIHASLLNALADAILNQSLDGFYLYLFLQFGYLIVNSIVKNIHSILNRISGELVTNKIKVAIIEKAKEVDLASFDNPEFYERLENANREAGNRPIQILQSLFSIISTIISVVIYIVAMARILPLAPLFIVLVSIPSAVVNFIYRRKNFNYMRRRSIDRREMNYYSGLMVNRDMVKEIRLFGLSDRFIDGYKSVFVRYFGGLKKLIYAEGFWHVFFTLLSTLINCTLFIAIARNVIFGAGQIGDFSFYTGALNSIASGVSSLIGTSATIYEGTLFIDNLILFMNEKRTIIPRIPEQTAAKDSVPVSKPLDVKRHTGHTIVFDHVSFRYPGAERDVLRDINLTFNPGDTCVLVGLNGAGKTTLIKLLTRLYDPTEGTIYLDGNDIRAYDVEQLYKMFGIIFQDFGKYAFTVTDNIAFGDIERPLDMDEVREAAVCADADTYISDLPQGYATPLQRIFSESGKELSIGQWQKLSIARAFYSDSDFLILDEPTASLDAIAEQEVFRQFDRLRRDKTTLFVSHRLSSATVANKIIVLDGGTVAEMGDHATLMRARGKYYELFSAQAKRYISTAEEGLIAEEDMEEVRAYEADPFASQPHPHGGQFHGEPPHGRPPHTHPMQEHPAGGKPPKPTE